MSCQFLFHRVCLKPKYSLRQQLLLSFALPAFLVIVIVVFLAAFLGASAGDEVQLRADRVLKEQVITSFGYSSRSVAEQITAYLHSSEGALQLIVEVTRDRIVGYPKPGWEADEFVPFLDTYTNTNIYPLKTPPPPLDWNITSNVQPDTIFEHFQDRIGSSNPAVDRAVTTASGVYHFQGSCDPNEDNPSARGYFPNCTIENNNRETGGSIRPTQTSQWLQKKAGDIATLIKPIYEAQPDVLLAGVYFANSGAGSTLWYPGHKIATDAYVSDGCQWMNETNPLSNEPYATPDEISRCHKKGVVVPIREYNPLDRAWFRDCVENSADFRWQGPYTALDSGLRLFSVCRSVFDRKTSHLIGAVTIDISLEDTVRSLRSSRLYNGTSDIVIVRYEDAVIFADTLGLSTERSPVYETDFISKENFLSLNRSFDFKVPQFTHEEVVQAFQGNAILSEQGVYTAFPLPLPPSNASDVYYRPTFLVLHRAPHHVLFGAVEEMDQEIAEDYRKVAILVISLGVGGIVVVFAIVWFVSRVITEPLRWIEIVAWNIVNHRDKNADDKLNVEQQEEEKASCRFTPNTEIKQLITEFHLMLNGFSGRSASSLAYPPPIEIPNEMTWRSDFRDLYTARSPKDRGLRKAVDVTDYDVEPVVEIAGAPERRLEVPDPNPGAAMIASIVPAPLKQNFGRNANVDSQLIHRKSILQDEFDVKKIVSCRTSLFWWILVLMAIPLAFTNVSIAVNVSIKVVSAVPAWISIVEEASLELERGALNSSAYLMARTAESMSQEVVRDLHLMTRLAGWLIFGAVERSDALADMDEAAEDCKLYPRDASCPFFSSGRTSCACEWEDPQVDNCVVFDKHANTRAMQRRFWHIPASDAIKNTGNRVISSFPEVDFMPNTTLWWNTTNDLPGSYRGSNASGFRTAYDRIKVTSAMSVVDLPIYNYGRSLRRKKHDLGSFLGFDADGGMTGYDGCVYGHAYVSHWSSNEQNRAFEIAPELCPKGKFGYDCRCRGWYSIGKRNYLQKGKSIYITAPYLFASDGKAAASVTAPIASQATGQYVGQALLDFSPSAIRDSLSRLKEPISFLITPLSDATGGDTVVGPDRSLKEWEPANILDLLFNGSESRRNDFAVSILLDMKDGNSNLTKFWPSLKDEPARLSSLAYFPVYTRSYQAASPDDFARGVHVTRTLVYTVAIASYDDDLRRPFQEIEDETYDHVEFLGRIYLYLVAFVTLTFTIYTCMITAEITRPMITLLHVVQTINAGLLEDDLPPLRGGSKEVNQIYQSLAKLIKIVKMSNVAFFSGNNDWAHEIILDALKLFRKLGDEKAFGIASNNLGNTLYAITQEAEEYEEIDLGAGLYSIYENAMGHYDDAVRIGEKFFDEALDENTKAEGAQQLADRLFNRALFGLLAFTRGTAPDDARDLALSDLKRVRELDDDVSGFWLERKLLLRNSDVYFCRLLRRIHGLTDVYADQGVQEIWDPSALVEAADILLFAAWEEAEAPIFNDMTRIGRLQQLEDAAMRLDLRTGKVVEAARLAMRILAEDEFVLESSFVTAAQSLVEFMREKEADAWTTNTRSSCRQDLRRMMRSCKTASVSLGKNLVIGLDMSARFEGHPIVERIQENCVRLYDLCCSKDDYFGVVASTVCGELNVELSLKDDNEGIQRANLELATSFSSSCMCPVLPYATQMVIDSGSAVPTENDSFIIVISDGLSCDVDSIMSLRAEIHRLNRQKGSSIHVLILGLEIEKAEVVESYKSISTVSKLSLYSGISMSNVDAAFGRLANRLNNNAISASRFQSITMEKF